MTAPPALKCTRFWEKKTPKSELAYLPLAAAERNDCSEGFWVTQINFTCNYLRILKGLVCSQSLVYISAYNLYFCF